MKPPLQSLVFKNAQINTRRKYILIEYVFLFYVFREVNKEPERLDGINM